ncbi:PREDICTED: uncharacterized protein LOC109154002 [Ipomoea nil]|uniref:uncharacterized protein LOC109154002 n=1 Tax=Ipomoea nil TaxID=35883 RepID=UPI000900A8C0|nr:PREDICTED: uncharacterized protein LOC109154002 [Ipomoea nil]
MDLGDYRKQGSVPPSRLNYRGNGDDNSAEDLAWADSCLIGDPEISEGDLDSFRNAFALLDIQSSQLKSSVDQKGEFCEAANEKIFLFGRKGRSSLMLDKPTTYNPPPENEKEERNRIRYDQIMLNNEQEGNMIDYYPISLSNEQEGNMVDYYPFSLSNEQAGNMIDYDQILLSNEQEGNIFDSQQINESANTFSSKFDSENVFLPTYNENQRIFVTDDPEKDSNFPAFLEDLPAENIFKVWEFDIPDEEDELIGQVKKAIAQRSLEQGANDQSLDDIISGIADMSLSPNFS